MKKWLNVFVLTVIFALAFVGFFFFWRGEYIATVIFLLAILFTWFYYVFTSDDTKTLAFRRKTWEMPFEWTNKMVLVVGTTGSGKTNTIKHFYNMALEKGLPIIIVDGKPDETHISWTREQASIYNRDFYGFNCENFCGYDFLSCGNETELKDKIISLKHWENEYYRSMSEVYLQTVFKLLKGTGKTITLDDVIRLLDYSELAKEARAIKDETLINEVKRRSETKRDELKGLQAHLEMLANSEFGEFFYGERAVKLIDVIESKAVMFFALPILTYPSFASLLGKLVINDIKATIAKTNNQVFCIFDEFSVFAGEQVLNLVNMGRAKGVHAILGTQGLDDLAKENEKLKGQILNCVNTLIIHRVNSPSDAEELSAWIGTEDATEITKQIDFATGQITRGSLRTVRRYIVHPDKIKSNLAIGEAIIVSKCTTPTTIQEVVFQKL